MPKLVMHPSPGDRLLRFVGDHLRFSLRWDEDARWPAGGRAFLRTNLGRGRQASREVIESHTGKLPLAGASWRDIPLRRSEDEWTIDLPAVESGFFKAKVYYVDAEGRQHWPDGPDVGISIHPSFYRTANIIYCAFARMFGESRFARSTADPERDRQLGELDRQGYTVIPPSGKFRDLIRELPHIFDTLGCRILHLLPVNPTPTTYARFGRFGSPYACQDLIAVDPALAEFDRRTTGVEQFEELARAVHAKGGRLFLDMVVNHTGWGSTLQETHPEWFLKDASGVFVSPGAWGNTWEDLVEIDHTRTEPWDEFAEVFLTWCRRGVDGFRCDAGYKVPMPAWRYITARVRDEFPDTIFLLEGLGGSWEATELLLTEGGMQWAYSELFQNYAGWQVADYLDYALSQSARVGLYAHYSETHDNNRLAEQGRAWSLLRNRICALTSVSGAYGYACGVEWLAAEKINVHSSRGMSWGNPDNIIPELRELSQLLARHPCFFDGARLDRISSRSSPIYALRRESREGLDRVLVLINTDVERSHSIRLGRSVWEELGRPSLDLLGQAVGIQEEAGGEVEITLGSAVCACLASAPEPAGLAGDAYRRARELASWGWQALGHVFPVEQTEPGSWRALAELIQASPKAFLALLPHLNLDLSSRNLAAALEAARASASPPSVIVWKEEDQRRVLPVPPGHWLLIEDSQPFRGSLRLADGSFSRHLQSIQCGGHHFASLEPGRRGGLAQLALERHGAEPARVTAQLRFLTAQPAAIPEVFSKEDLTQPLNAPLALLTNGIGGMARLCADLGRVKSKYDCLLAANLHPAVPVDRHVFAKRIRAWLNADRFITPLDAQNLLEFSAGPPAVWRFAANAGDCRRVEITLEACMMAGRNTTVLRFQRAAAPPGSGEPLDAGCEVRLALRVDLEDRNFHHQTSRNPGAEHHFTSHCRAAADAEGFDFAPAPDRRLRAISSAGHYLASPEWSEHISHPVEQSRGQTGHGDAWSPGWFDIPLAAGASVILIVTAEPNLPSFLEAERALARTQAERYAQVKQAELPESDSFGRSLAAAMQDFVVRRDSVKTVIAGYPWFLDWGRDSLIAARGLLSGGMTHVVQELLEAFGRFEQKGTLPNSIHGEDAANRDTSDAPLWYGVVAEEAAAAAGNQIYLTAANARRQTLTAVLRNIAAGYLRGAPNGIRCDTDSALIWSPRHFTWMDTNYPAGTPREGYPIEIQALWIRLLRQLDRIGAEPETEPWSSLASRAEESLSRLYWLEDKGYFADLLIADAQKSAAQARVDSALRSNCLFVVSLGIVSGERARRCVEAAAEHLVIPGALRSLAPLPVDPPLPIHSNDGWLLNDPSRPYQGRYEGDEDTRRKPAYHNGTAWTWTFPTFCEALALAWDFHPDAVAAAKAYLASMAELLGTGCIGQLPEVADGDAPHQPRGCDAQAWSATEALRVWKLLHKERPH